MRRGGPSVRWFSSRRRASRTGALGRRARRRRWPTRSPSIRAGLSSRSRPARIAPRIAIARSAAPLRSVSGDPGTLPRAVKSAISSAVDPVTQCEGRWADRLVAPVPDHGQQPGGRVGPEQPAGELEAVDVGGHHPRGGSLRLETAHSPPGGWSRWARRADLQGREGGRVDAGPLHGPGPATPGRPTSNRMPLPPECWPCPARRDQPAGGQGGRPAHTRRAQWGRPAPAAGLRPGSRWVYCSAA